MYYPVGSAILSANIKKKKCHELGPSHCFFNTLNLPGFIPPMFTNNILLYSYVQ